MAIKKEKQFQYLEVLTGLFVAILLISNIASSKLTAFGPFTLDAGVILFPLAYLFGDVLTEVYGYGRARKVIWIGLICNLIMALTFMAVGALPPAPDWPNQDAYSAILGLTPRIVLASIAAYFVGEFINSFILAKVKLITNGRMLWIRTIGSTLIGQLLDSAIFVLIAFSGLFPTEVIIALIFSNYVFKVAIEVLFTPVTYRVVNFLKRAEGEDYYDRNTNFNPFKLLSKKK